MRDKERKSERRRSDPVWEEEEKKAFPKRAQSNSLASLGRVRVLKMQLRGLKKYLDHFVSLNISPFKTLHAQIKWVTNLG